MTRSETTKPKPILVTAIGLTALAVFGTDLVLPLGIAIWIFYLVPVALSLYDWRPKAPLLVAGAVTVLMVVGYSQSPPPVDFPPGIPRTNRGIGIATAWALAWFVRQFIVTKVKLRERDWVRSGQRDLSACMQGEQDVSQLGDQILKFLCGYLGAPVGALYVTEQGDNYRLRATHAVASGQPHPPERLGPGDSLLGQAIKDQKIVQLDQLPPGYLTVSSALGRMDSAHVVIVPTAVDGQVKGAIELGFRRPASPPHMDLLENAADSIAIAIRSAQYRMRQAELLGETRQQAVELQAQQEELRVTNEELEEQSRALKESQSRLEEQHAELEQTNANLEAQARILERQRDEVAHAQAALIEKADALERANHYKSEFLANMSHELRTPLNSALILAKVLSDNQDGNLTPEQVKFASTIHSSANDLLALINDILDLARIEAGAVDIHPESVTVTSVLASLEKTFQPIAEQKHLPVAFVADPDLPELVKTDPLRLQQILRNLLSNALKFTETGEVTLRISRAAGERLAFSVHDTGVGIPAEQHEIIFEAFRQADGSTHRKYGGSGLGLTISRELARRMGGTLTLDSAAGRGSTFTLVLPFAIDGAAATECPPLPAAKPAVGAAAKPVVAAPTRQTEAVPEQVAGIEDDRETMAPGERSILVIEDDQRFAAILRDLARELKFRCLVATRAADGLRLAAQFLPTAILLDVHLPDQSGLALLEQLKRSPDTRHIPVHVLSVADYTQQALELGAVGYALKPVKREQIVGAIKRLETKLEQDVRRILVVEDAQVQRDSIEALLRRDGVELVSVGKGQEALKLLGESTFDCVVLDLSLPDISGYELLEKLASGEAFSFPPVIVYTGRALSRDEERHLRRFTSSIIIKGARSPERLLDEVSLFMHEVETKLPPEQQRMLRLVRQREAAFEGRIILVVEDDSRNIFALSSILEPKGAKLRIARNGREALDVLERAAQAPGETVDIVLMDIMMPVMDGLAAMREIRRRPEWKKLPIIALTAKAMSDDRLRCIEAGANDYIAKPLDVDKLVSLLKVWLPK